MLIVGFVLILLFTLIVALLLLRPKAGENLRAEIAESDYPANRDG